MIMEAEAAKEDKGTWYLYLLIRLFVVATLVCR